jgi:DsbC/DsbD-like thiol-disulfide interchange protein
MSTLRGSSAWRNALVALLGVLSAFVPAAAGQTAETHAKVELIADPNHNKLPGAISVGLLFQLDPGWHIYWQNAGDSGEPPKVQWQLPEGFRGGPIRWPTPIRLGTGSVIDYGYENQVLLMSRIEAPRGSQIASMPISADVRYVVCREICIPANAHLSISVPEQASSGQTAEWRKLIKDSRARLPKPAPDGWKVSAQSMKNEFALIVAGAKTPQKASFFPLRPGVIENSAEQKLTPRHDGFRLSLRKAESLTQPISELAGILVLDDGSGYTINVRVVATYELHEE